MASFSVKIDDRIEERFRKNAMAKYGMKRGCLTKALEEAMIDYCNKIEASAKV